MIDRENLKAFVDGELSGPEADEIRRELDADPTLRSEVDRMRAIGNILRAEVRPVEVLGKDATLTLLNRKARRPWFRSTGFLSLAAAAAMGVGIFFCWKSLSPSSMVAEAAKLDTVAAMSPKEAQNLPERATLKSPAVVAPADDAPKAAAPSIAEAPAKPPPDNAKPSKRRSQPADSMLAKPAPPQINSSVSSDVEAKSKKVDAKFDSAQTAGVGGLEFKPTSAGAASKLSSARRGATTEEVVKLARTQSVTTDAVRKLIDSAEAKVVTESTLEDKQILVIEVDSDKAARLLEALRSIGGDPKAETRSVSDGSKASATMKAKADESTKSGPIPQAPAPGVAGSARAKKRTIRIEIPIVHPGKGPDKSE